MTFRWPVALVVVAALAACSSTNRQTAAGRPSPEATAIVDPGAVPSATTPVPGEPAAGVRAGQGRAPRAAVRTSGPAATTVTDASGRTITTRGIDEKTVKVGFRISTGYEQAVGSIGLNLTTGDARKQVEAVFDAVNSTGGLVGRRAVPVIYDFGQDLSETAEQANCDAWTQDDHVFAGVSSWGSSVLLPRCLAKADVPFVTSAGDFDRHDIEDLAGHFHLPSMMNLHRLAEPWARGLDATKYFGDAPVVGLLRLDEQAHKRPTEEALKPALARRGITIATEYAFPRSLEGIGSQAGAAVLRMNAANVTHVLILDWAGAISLFFMTAAEQQRYRPRYGLSSITPLVAVTAIVPPDQLARAAGAGWRPGDDVGFAQDPGPSSDNVRVCEEVMKKHDINMSDRMIRAHSLGYCDVMFFLRLVVERAAAVTTPGLAKTVDGLGTAYLSPLTFSTRFVPGRRDGVASARPLAFSTACTCFEYAGPPVAAE